VVTKRFRVASASLFGISVLILLAGMLILPDNSLVHELSTIPAVAVDALAFLAGVAAPVCLLSAAGWVIAVILDARQQANSDSILDWRLE
jgi:hypothetical protein